MPLTEAIETARIHSVAVLMGNHGGDHHPLLSRLASDDLRCAVDR
jgi:hypothetical protein